MSELFKTQAKERPVGVTILAILAGIAAVFAAIHAIQYLGIFHSFIGSSGYTVHNFSFWYSLMYGLLVWVYIWLTVALWRVEPGAWMFLVIVTMFYLILDFFFVVWRNYLGRCSRFGDRRTLSSCCIACSLA